MTGSPETASERGAQKQMNLDICELCELKMDKTKSNKNRYFYAKCQWSNCRTFNVEREFNVGLASVVLDVARVRAGVLGLVVLQQKNNNCRRNSRARK